MLKEYDQDQIRSLAYTGSLIKGAAHNINTPLSSIMGRADILRLRFDRMLQCISDSASLQEFEKCRRDISLILDNCNKVSALVKNVVYRCHSAPQNTIQPVNIARVLLDDLEFLMSDMEFKHNIEQKYRIDTLIPTILGAPVHFSNSFIEIIENAQAAMLDTEEKMLSVCVHSDACSIVVAISDNGCGMSEETHQAVMHRLDHPSVSGSGTVSGLGNVARLLKPYNPRYQVESRPGETTLTVEFPV